MKLKIIVITEFWNFGNSNNIIEIFDYLHNVVTDGRVFLPLLLTFNG